VGRALAEVRTLTPENPAQQHEIAGLDTLVRARLAHAEKVVQARREESAEAAWKLVAAGAGRDLTQAVRQQLARMNDEEHRLIVLREAESLRAERWSLAEAMLARLVAVALFSAAFISYRRENHRRATAEAALQLSNATLQERIRQHTAELVRANALLEVRFHSLEQGEEEMSRLLANAEESRRALLSIVEDQQQAEDALRASSEELRALARHLEGIREEQAERIARELHDELGQALTILKLHVRSLQKKLEAQSGAPPPFEGREALDLIDGAVRSVRLLCVDLRPPALIHLGLQPAIEALAADFRARSEIACHLRLPPELPVLDPHCQTTVYRIVQELLTNVARHAAASEVNIVLRVEASTLVIEVADNGRGIAAEELAGTGSLGLLGLRERALAHGGSISIAGQPGRGTTGLVRIPLVPPHGNS
jgi:signal transduction histidine kinase